MDETAYRAEVLAAYAGELAGEVTAATLRDHLRVDAGRVAKLELLRQLEARVATALEPLVARFGGWPGDRRRLIADARSRAHAISDWDGLLLALGPRLDAYISRFQALLAAARPGDEDALKLLLLHEEVLREFGTREAAGDAEGALACLETALASHPARA